MDCQAQVSGYPNNLHQSFPSRQEGEHALAQYPSSQRNKTPEPKHLGEENFAKVQNKKLVDMTAKDFVLVLLFVVVVIQAYLLYHAWDAKLYCDVISEEYALYLGWVEHNAMWTKQMWTLLSISVQHD